MWECIPHTDPKLSGEDADMLLAINVGNSRISVGCFDSDSNDLRFRFQIATDLNKTSDEYFVLLRALIREYTADDEKIDGGILSSVVPQLTETVRTTMARLVGKEPLVVGPGVKTGFAIKIDAPAELGSDMVANAAAVIDDLKKKGKVGVPSVVVDMGTVTTVSAINKNGEYVGCAIAPGIRMSFDGIHGETAQLPNVAFSAPERVIGKNTQDSICSGVICGMGMMLDGFVGRFAKEMRCRAEDLNLVITGEYASAVMPVCIYSYVEEKDLTLRGLACLFYKMEANR